MKTIGIIGCGNLGLSILKGLRKAYPTLPIIASRRNIDSLSNYADSTTRFTTSNEEVLHNAEIVIIALKPFSVIEFVTTNRAYFDFEKHIVISVATGIRISEIQEAIQNSVIPIFRGMPNTAADVQESITALSGTGTNEQKNEVESVFNAIGESVWIDEQLMESATILGACGIAYVLRFIRAMIQGGIEVGFDAKTANKIVSQTVKGAAQLLIQNGLHPEEEIDKVTTPKGCTIVGLNEMEHSGFSSALIKGIVTSYQKIERK